ncbi:hypothetical protein NE236_31030 [Actinoallomurus purpureus]|uniref:hypothetical protein n=1 Tax=Actinoallomurus purpureus TaxID=478114 RepID=UPI0020926594|nr:hypothetical protein [Actinoallomurus purpureus]MCO6009414.1 hypothetical protein [Actinoallomurus purpureus]
MTVEEILWWIGGVEMPKGDSGKARQAAAIWGQIADRIESSIRTTDPMATDIWTLYHGLGIDAFKKFWTKDFAPYPHELAAYCRRIQAVCNGYADAVDKMRLVLTLLAIQTYLNILFTIAYGWVTGWMGTLAELAVIRDRAAIQAVAQRTLFQKIMIKLLEYLFDSIGYAAGQQLLQMGTFGVADLFMDYDDDAKKIIGYDPYSMKANGVQFAQAVGANFAFDAANDMTAAGLGKAGPLGRVLSSGAGRRVLGFGSRMVGSNVYTVVGNMEQGKQPSEWLPTWQQEVDKLIIHGSRMAKNPAKGPIGSGRTGP